MLSINQSYFMIFSLLNQSLKAMFFQTKYSNLARSIYSHGGKRVGRFLRCEDFPILLPLYALFICENAVSASDIS
jgi:hypothetical protein